MVESQSFCLLSADLSHDPTCTTYDVDWQSILLLLGKPGTGKTFTLHKSIQYCLQNNTSVAVAFPTGTLARTYRQKYGDSVACDTA